MKAEPATTYEIWVKDLDGTLCRRMSETGFARPERAQSIADDYNAESASFAKTNHLKNHREFFVVKATTSFEEFTS
jgi:hypothetical protein